MSETVEAGAQQTSPLPAAAKAPGLAGVILVIVAALGLLAVNTAVKLCATPVEDRWQHMTRRYWEDMYYAIGHRLTGQFPRSYLAVRRYRGPQGVGFREARPTLTAAAREAQIEPWQFWRTVDIDRFLRRRRPPLRVRFDDAGRPLMLSALFGLMGGVSPFLLYWIGLLAFAPVLLWLGFELYQARQAIAAIALATLLATSAYVADTLALSYAAMGFYLICLLALAALSVYSAFAPIRPRGLLFRALAAGLALGLCSVARASALIPMFAMALALALAAWRYATAVPWSRRRRLGAWLALTGLSTVLLCGPYFGAARHTDHLIDDAIRMAKEPVPDAARQPQRHALWFGIWVGLGDFDRERGYIWNDRAAFLAAERRGGERTVSFLYDSRNEPILRDQVLADIFEDPLWFAEIVARRVAATALLWKILPWTPVDGHSFRTSEHPNEGYVDAYYTLTATADRIRMGRFDAEIPLLGLMLPTWALVLIGSRRRSLRPQLVVLGTLALGAMALPAAITTASAVETQAFVLVYMVGASFALQAVIDGLRREPAGLPASSTPH